MRRVTIRDVAHAAGVSVATVSRALNRAESVTPDTSKRVRAAAASLDYIPHSGARSLSTRRTDTIGVLLPDLHGEFFSELIRGIDVASREHGLHLLLSHSHGDSAEAVAVLRAMRSRVDAMLVMSPYADDAMLSAAVNGAAPLVLLGHGGGAGDRPAFSVDNHAGAAAVTNHLLDRGYRRIAYIGGPADNVEAGQRLAGFEAALAARGIATGPVLAGDFLQGSGVRAVEALLSGPLPDAIFAANDMMAIGALQALRDAGLRVPVDVALAGFDDIPVARFLDPPLTTVAVPIAEIGRRAVQCCINLVSGKGGVGMTFAPELVIRASTSRSIESPRNSRANGEDLSHELCTNA